MPNARETAGAAKAAGAKANGAPMRYLSIFSGVEAATLAWEPLGWEALAFCEIEPFPSAVLKERWPGVPNLGDITKVDWGKFIDEIGRPDLVVGGSPCQSFSVAGKREGLRGASGLMFEYIRCVRELMPRWFVWENVPGALSSEGGKAFGQLAGEMDALGYGLAWRVLDAQFFGVAQRRERLFLVGHLGDTRACEVLFEPESLRWDTPSSREKRKALAAAAGCGAQARGGGLQLLNPGIHQSEHVFSAPSAAPCLDASTRHHEPKVLVPGARRQSAARRAMAFAQNTRDEVRIVGDGTLSGALAANPGAKQTTYVCETQYGEDIAGCLTARGDSSPCSDRGQNVVCMTDTMPNTHIDHETSGALLAHSGKEAPVVAFKYHQGSAAKGIGAEIPNTPATRSLAPHSHAVEIEDDQKVEATARRLTPLECERLQGFQDNHTRIAWRGKTAEECPDTPRYKAIGNSMAVPVMRWIGERIQETDRP